MIYLTVAILFLSVAKKLSIAQKTTLRIKDFFIKCEKNRPTICRFPHKNCCQPTIIFTFLKSFLRIWSYLLKKSFMKNFIFCAVIAVQDNNYITVV